MFSTDYGLFLMPAGVAIATVAAAVIAIVLPNTVSTKTIPSYAPSSRPVHPRQLGVV